MPHTFCVYEREERVVQPLTRSSHVTHSSNVSGCVRAELTRQRKYENAQSADSTIPRRATTSRACSG